jgi:alkylation response protein AidB-like acyl-CoA dehydrogenase
LNFTETTEQQMLRQAVAEFGAGYGMEYFTRKALVNERTTELWHEAGQLGYLGVNIPEEYGGGGGGIYELQITTEELAAAGCPLLLIVVSQAIVATIIARTATDEQKKRWLPGLAEGTFKVAFAITEPDAGSNAHKLTTIARRDGDDYLLNGRKVFISGVDESDAVLIVARLEESRTGKLKPALFILPRQTLGFEYREIPMAFVSAEKQYGLFLDDVRLPADALIGNEDTGLPALFYGLNPERITVAAFANGISRFALDRAVEYAKSRQVFDVPIGQHQGIAHPLAEAKIALEQARLLTQKAAWLYDTGDLLASGECANMAKYAAAEAATKAADQAIQTHGGNGMTLEYGVGVLAATVRAARIAPVSREMILNFVAQHSLGLPKSY